MSVTRDLLTGLGAELAAAGVGVTASGAPFDPAATAIVYSAVPQDPDRVVILSAYRLGGDDPAHPVSQINVQVRTRGRAGAAADVDVLDDAVHDVIQGLTDRAYGSCHVTQALLKSSLPLGRDDNNRYERSSNYTFDCDVPATPNRAY